MGVRVPRPPLLITTTYAAPSRFGGAAFSFLSAKVSACTPIFDFQIASLQPHRCPDVRRRFSGNTFCITEGHCHVRMAKNLLKFTGRSASLQEVGRKNRP